MQEQNLCDSADGQVSKTLKRKQLCGRVCVAANFVGRAEGRAGDRLKVPVIIINKTPSFTENYDIFCWRVASTQCMSTTTHVLCVLSLCCVRVSL